MKVARGVVWVGPQATVPALRHLLVHLCLLTPYSIPLFGLLIEDLSFPDLSGMVLRQSRIHLNTDDGSSVHEI